MDFAKNMDILLRDKGLTATKLAEMANLPRTTISSWTTRGSRPSVHDAFTVAQVLGVTVEELMTGKAPEIPGVSARVQGIAQDLDALDDSTWSVMAGMIHDAAERCRKTVSKAWEESAG